MKLTSNLIIVISAILVGQAMAAPLVEDGSPIKHPAPEEKLNQDQLVEMLSSPHINLDNSGTVAEYFAEQLYLTKDKDTTEVLDGVTVQELIDLNQLNLNSCGNESMKKRSSVQEKLLHVEAEKSSVPRVFGAQVYYWTLLFKTIAYCHKNMAQVVKENINDGNTIKRMVENFPVENISEKETEQFVSYIMGHFYVWK